MEKQIDPIGQLLRKTRTDRKVSVPELAKLLGIPKDRIYKWENGATPKYEDRQIVDKWIKDGNWKPVPNIPNQELESKLAASPITLQDHINEIKAHRAATEAYASKLEADKNRLYGIIENYLNSILANSVKNQDDMAILKAQADMAIKQLARQDELIIQKSEALKGGKVKSGKADHND